MILDIDQPAAAFAWQDLVATPNFVTINKKNSHAHLAWSLKAGVSKTSAARIGPLRYLAAVEQGYTIILDADPGFTGLITKNPLSDKWRTWEIHGHAYELGELADFIDLSALKPQQPGAVSGLGRNCTLFDTARQWAYRAVSQYWSRSETDWHSAVLSQCQAINMGFMAPLPASEVSATARSIAKWVWRHHTPKTRAALIQRTHTSALQAQRGKQSGTARWVKSLESRARAIELASDGLSTRQIAVELGVNQSTVVRWLAN